MDNIDLLQDSYTIEEAADIMRVSVKTIKKWIHEGRLTAIILSERKTFIPKTELNIFIEASKSD